MRFARVHDVVLHYRVEGPEAAPALVFANSLGTDFRIWDALLDHLGGRFRAIRYDKRGQGLSDCAAAPYSIADHVGDLAGLLNHLGVERAVVVGLSIGGMIAQGLAAARPDLVRALVLCDTGHRIGSPSLWEDRIAAIRAGGIEALAGPILERWFSARFRAERPDELAGWRNMLVRTPREGYLGCCAAIRDADLTGAARGLAVPVLCLCGSEDGATPPDLVRALAALIPGARFALIEGAAHLPCIEAPAALAGLIMDFFEEKALVQGV
ncbi:MAG: 3-oxoadipate enol-lactonase [Kiloniellales bacterium]